MLGAAVLPFALELLALRKMTPTAFGTLMALEPAMGVLLGLIVLPIENVIVFSVQLGRGIEAMPWWITLAVVGAVLLIIAVTSERRAGEGRGVVARVRDMR